MTKIETHTELEVMVSERIAVIVSAFVTETFAEVSRIATVVPAIYTVDTHTVFVSNDGAKLLLQVAVRLASPVPKVAVTCTFPVHFAMFETLAEKPWRWQREVCTNVLTLMEHYMKTIMRGDEEESI
jgi:hypothetical protein